MSMRMFASATAPDWDNDSARVGESFDNLRWYGLGMVIGNPDDASLYPHVLVPWVFQSSTNNAGTMLTLDQNGNNKIFDLDSAATTADVLGMVANSLTTAGLINASSNSADTGTRTLVIVKNDNTAATGATVAEYTQDAAATNVKITHTAATGVALNVVADSITTQAGVFNVSVDAMTTAKAARVESTSTVVTSGELLTLDHTATSTAGTGLSNKSGNLVSIASSLTEARTGGTTALDFDMLSLIRTAETTGASGTMTNTGSVLHVETVLTQTAGTLTDTTRGLEVVMSANGTGTGIYVDSNAATAVGFNMDAENTTVYAIVVDSSVATTAGVAQFTSNSTSTSIRSLVQIFNQNAAANATYLLELKQMASEPFMLFNYVGTAAASAFAAMAFTGMATIGSFPVFATSWNPTAVGAMNIDFAGGNYVTALYSKIS